MTAEGLVRQEREDVGVDLEVGEVDARDAVLLGQEGRELVLVDVAELRELVAEAPFTTCR